MRKKVLWGFFLVIALTAAELIVHGNVQGKKDRKLEVGIFIDSNWGVANANGFLLIDSAINEFKQCYPGVDVHYYGGIRKDSYSEWLSGTMLDGNAPDVFFIVSSDLNKLANCGALENLDGWINRDSAFDRSSYYTPCMSSGNIDGIQYALPYETVPTMMFVNKSLLAKEGIEVPKTDWTWDDLYDIASKVTKDTNGDGIIDQFAIYNYGWTDAVYSNDARVFDEKGDKAYFTDRKVLSAIHFMKQLKNLNNGQEVTQNDFDAGNVAFMPMPFSDYRAYKTYPYKIKKYTQFQWDCIMLPAGPDGSNTSSVSTLTMGISSHSTKKQEAWNFLKMITSDRELQMNLFKYSQGASVMRSVTNSREADDILKNNMENTDLSIGNELLDSIIENGVATPDFSNYNGAMSIANTEINRIINGTDDFDYSLQILQRQETEYLKK